MGQEAWLLGCKGVVIVFLVAESICVCCTSIWVLLLFMAEVYLRLLICS